MTFLCIHGIIIGAGESCIRCGYSPMGAMGSPQDGPVGRGEGRGVRLPAASTIPQVVIDATEDFITKYGDTLRDLADA